MNSSEASDCIIRSKCSSRSPLPGVESVNRICGGYVIGSDSPRTQIPNSEILGEFYLNPKKYVR